MSRIFLLLPLAYVLSSCSLCESLWLSAYRAQGGGYENQDLQKQKVHSTVHHLDDGRWHRRYTAHPEVQ